VSRREEVLMQQQAERREKQKQWQLAQQQLDEKSGSKPVPRSDEPELGVMVEEQTGNSLESSKIRWLIGELKEVTKQEKVLVVSQWTTVLDHVADMFALHIPQIHFCQLDGRTAPMQRAGVIDMFQENTEHRICLVSLGACAEGVTLTAASRVYHLDLWWNEAKDYQMANRVHRIGQLKDVQIVHVITEDTIEEKMMGMREKKRKVADLSLGIFDDEEGMDYINNVRLLFDIEEEAANAEKRRRRIVNLDSDDSEDDPDVEYIDV
jgi:SNF2 family DNA or RNA helicase